MEMHVRIPGFVGVVITVAGLCAAAYELHTVHQLKRDVESLKKEINHESVTEGSK